MKMCQQLLNSLMRNFIRPFARLHLVSPRLDHYLHSSSGSQIDEHSPRQLSSRFVPVLPHRATIAAHGTKRSHHLMPSNLHRRKYLFNVPAHTFIEKRKMETQVRCLQSVLAFISLQCFTFARIATRLTFCACANHAYIRQ